MTTRPSQNAAASRATWRRLKSIILVLAGTFALTGCISHPRPVVMLMSTNEVTIHYRDDYGLLRYEGHPAVEASINGVTGHFIIDTGATIPMLTMTGAQRCGVPLSPATKAAVPFWDGKVNMKVATNVSVTLAPGLVVRWPTVVVHPGFEQFFGIIDYTTLKSGHAVMDVSQKTIRMTR